jgi:hypothetical protein
MAAWKISIVRQSGNLEAAATFTGDLMATLRRIFFGTA